MSRCDPLKRRPKVCTYMASPLDSGLPAHDLEEIATPTQICVANVGKKSPIHMNCTPAGGLILGGLEGYKSRITANGDEILLEIEDADRIVLVVKIHDTRENWTARLLYGRTDI